MYNKFVRVTQDSKKSSFIFRNYTKEYVQIKENRLKIFLLVKLNF